MQKNNTCDYVSYPTGCCRTFRPSPPQSHCDVIMYVPPGFQTPPTVRCSVHHGFRRRLSNSRARGGSRAPPTPTSVRLLRRKERKTSSPAEARWEKTRRVWHGFVCPDVPHGSRGDNWQRRHGERNRTASWLTISYRLLLVANR